MENKNKVNDFVRFIFGHNRKLNNIIRFSTRLRNFDENVAAHSFYVSLYCVILADIVEEKGVKVDKEKLLKGALFHDLEECASGDVITTFKKNMKEAYTKLSRLSIISVFQNLPENLKEDYVKIWEEHEKGVEGWILDIADDLEGMIYCQEQIDCGNLFFVDIRNDYFNRIDKNVKGTELAELTKYLKELLLTENKTIELHQEKHEN
jgi:5'-deoxynucleotidase YfbR-like HD superfamily hydrolase